MRHPDDGFLDTVFDGAEQQGVEQHDGRPAAFEQSATSSRCALVMSGPMSDVGSLHGPILIFVARSAIRDTTASPAEPTATTTETAMLR
ncbi:hypothetical protein GCM10014715_10960 [Streptomyces spiralis]|uniref:Uncharacterized protein n=1 Tax=Streptomyces spiralis TaxID=66376 RepID=A0A918ZLL4_9ACTN|nr:hypothetical protein GCM10014715_10960 [Streptomyces spiralis]